MEFDENEAIKYIREHVAPEIAAGITDDDELLNLIDLIFDYFEANGLLEIDSDPENEDELDVDDLNAYVVRMLKKDKGANLNIEDVPALTEAYLDYEDSLE